MLDTAHWCKKNEWILIHVLKTKPKNLPFLFRPDYESVGLIELGGGSAQIAFIPDDPIYGGKIPASVAGREYGVYCHSHLSYGTSMLTDRIKEYLVEQNPNAEIIQNPCMLTGKFLVLCLIIR